MTGEMLSQEEINALLGGLVSNDEISSGSDEVLTPEEIDALGEIGNISMGTAATTLFALLNHKVMITTPFVEVMTLESFKSQVTDDLIAVSVGYTEGLTGTNLMILNQNDVKIIADLMMGGPGQASDEPISELHLSAIAEAMNQMIGSSSTSLSQMFSKKIDISPPEAIQLNYAQEELVKILGSADPIVKISFRMQVEENIIDSQLMQVLPIKFAKSLVSNLFAGSMEADIQVEATQAVTEDVQQPSSYIESVSHNEPMPSATEPMPQVMANEYGQAGSSYPQQGYPQMGYPQPGYAQPDYSQQMGGYPNQMPNYGVPEVRPTQTLRDIEVQKPEFPNFGAPQQVYPKENMDVLMDVSLEVSVELGRTQKKIKEILEFGPGSVVELDHIAGEPVNVLVNGKFIAKGEVVVIDENFGIRITDIINPESRI